MGNVFLEDNETEALRELDVEGSGELGGEVATEDEDEVNIDDPILLYSGDESG